MQKLEEALNEVRDLHEKLLGWPAPDLSPPSYLPFPAGVEPLAHAKLEVDRLREMTKRADLTPPRPTWMPTADVFVSEEAFVVHLDVAGVSREDLKVSIHAGGEVIVSGDRKPPGKSEGYRRIAVERPWGRFQRSFVAPQGCRLDLLKARLVDGVLEVHVPLEKKRVPEEREVEVA